MTQVVGLIFCGLLLLAGSLLIAWYITLTH